MSTLLTSLFLYILWLSETKTLESMHPNESANVLHYRTYATHYALNRSKEMAWSKTYAIKSSTIHNYIHPYFLGIITPSFSFLYFTYWVFSYLLLVFLDTERVGETFQDVLCRATYIVLNVYLVKLLCLLLLWWQKFWEEIRMQGTENNNFSIKHWSHFQSIPSIANVYLIVL